MAFSTGTANREAAARIAANICTDFVTLGVEAALAKHRSQTTKPLAVATIGEWVAAAREVSEANPATFDAYAASLRLIAGQILAARIEALSEEMYEMVSARIQRCRRAVRQRRLMVQIDSTKIPV